MPRSGNSVRVAPGIYRHNTFVRVMATAGRTSREKHFPIGSDLKDMQRWQLTTKADLLSEQPTRPAKSSIAADVPRYLATLNGRRKNDDRALLQHWIDSTLANVNRHEITRTMIKAQLATWETAGVAASTNNHRLRVLRALYRELDGEDLPNPTLGIKKRPEPQPENRSQPVDLIEAIIAWMPDHGRPTKGESRDKPSLGKVRARVMLWTGLPPAQLMKLLRTHVNFTSKTLMVMPRRKGKGTKAVTVPLLPQAVDALRSFFNAGAEGTFSTSSFYKQWMRAQQRLLAAMKKLAIEQGQDPDSVRIDRTIRPYDVRHSFGSEAYRQSRNLLGVKKLMLHARLSTTERYLEGAVEESAVAVIDTWGKGR